MYIMHIRSDWQVIDNENGYKWTTTTWTAILRNNARSETVQIMQRGLYKGYTPFFDKDPLLSKTLKVDSSYAMNCFEHCSSVGKLLVCLMQYRQIAWCAIRHIRKASQVTMGP